MNAPHEQQEKKYRKRIGYLTLLNHEIVSKLPQYHYLFDLKRITLKGRLAFLASIPGAIEKQIIFENITPIVGFEVLTKLLTGNLGSLVEGEVNVHALGSGVTPPADGDTELETETIRKLIASSTYDENKAFYTVVYETTEANGTHREMGLFINADDGIPDDGTLWDRSEINITKTSAQSLTIDYEDTFVNE